MHVIIFLKFDLLSSTNNCKIIQEMQYIWLILQKFYKFIFWIILPSHYSHQWYMNRYLSTIFWFKLHTRIIKNLLCMLENNGIRSYERHYLYSQFYIHVSATTYVQTYAIDLVFLFRCFPSNAEMMMFHSESVVQTIA